MAEARDQILAGIRRALRRDKLDAGTAAKLAERLAQPTRNTIPGRAKGLTPQERIDLFRRMAESASASFCQVSSPNDVPDAVTGFLGEKNLPARAVMTNDPFLACLPWERAPLLEIRQGVAREGDLVSITTCLAGIAETGTLMLVSGALLPSRNNFLPETHIVILRSDQIVDSYEDGFDLLRKQRGEQMDDALPRTINFITGPSRTGDIEQQLHLGAHGPRRLHIIRIGEG